MKTYKYILLSYFQQPPFFVALLTLSMTIYLATLFSVIFSPGIPVKSEVWLVHMASIIFIDLIIAGNLKNVTKTAAIMLLPDYRKKQIITHGVFLFIFILLTTLIFGINSFSVLTISSLCLFTACLILWLIFLTDEIFIVFIVVLWTLRIIIELLGFKTESKITGTFMELTGLQSDFLFPLLLIIFSLKALAFFVIYYFRIPVYDSDVENIHDSAKFIDRKILKIRKGRIKPGLSLPNDIRFFEFSLFSPGYIIKISFSTIISTAAAFFTYGYIVAHARGGFQHIEHYIIPFIIFIYYMSSIMVTTDFLQHRNLLSSLWLQSPLTSRKNFTDRILLTYIYVIIKNYFLVSILLAAAFFILPSLSAVVLLQIYTLTLALSLCMVSFSIVFSSRLTSYHSVNWMVGNIILSTILLLILIKTKSFGMAENLSGTWFFSLTMVLLSAVVLRFAFIKWKDTEMSSIEKEQDLL